MFSFKYGSMQVSIYQFDTLCSSYDKFQFDINVKLFSTGINNETVGSFAIVIWKKKMGYEIYSGHNFIIAASKSPLFILSR